MRSHKTEPNACAHTPHTRLTPYNWLSYTSHSAHTLIQLQSAHIHLTPYSRLILCSHLTIGSHSRLTHTSYLANIHPHTWLAHTQQLRLGSHTLHTRLTAHTMLPRPYTRLDRVSVVIKALFILGYLLAIILLVYTVANRCQL